MGRGYDQLPIDTAVSGYSMIFGNANTQIKYNSGQNIMSLLQNLVDEDFSKVEQNSQNSNPVEQSGNQQQQDELDLLNSWDYKNIISQLDLEGFYPTIVSRHSGY